MYGAVPWRLCILVIIRVTSLSIISVLDLQAVNFLADIAAMDHTPVICISDIPEAVICRYVLAQNKFKNTCQTVVLVFADKKMLIVCHIARYLDSCLPPSTVSAT